MSNIPLSGSLTSSTSGSQTSSLSSTRQSSLFGLQDWTRIYQTYRASNLTSYDYTTLRKSFIDYLTTYYPESFNDYTESSEFIALLDIIAFMGQGLAFRDDLNARENFMDTAERRDSVIKLANLVSYNPKRNIESNGVVKVSSISSSESIFDINGVSLGNTTVFWNDPANPNWQQQFNTILNASLVNSQVVGRPGNTQDILGVTISEYTINITPGQNPVIPYIAQINGVLTNFELVSVTSLNKPYLYELPPAPTGQFNILYSNDGLGFGSPNTGFLFYFKQGTLNSFNFNFPERIQNNVQDINIQGINNSDTWLYSVSSNGAIDALWSQVENLFITNGNSQGNSATPIFEVASRSNDQVTYIFGDGVFGEIPVGNYLAYVRSSNGLTYSIDPSEMTGIAISIPYIGRSGNTESLTFTIDLQSVNNTAQGRQSIADIKQRAPARYYTQNRMVNGEDYTNFPFTLYNSIVKSSAVNRTSIGVSRGLDLLDPTGIYSSTNVFANDGALYLDPLPTIVTFSTQSINSAIQFISVNLPILLGLTSAVQYYQKYYPRYSGYYTGIASIDNRVYWQQTTLTSSNVTGYFYILTSGNVKTPIPLGVFSTFNMRYISQGSMLKFVAPVGYYFDSNDRLQQGIANPYMGDRSSIWIGVSAVVGDGYNFGNGNLENGLGPVTMNSYVPTGAFLDINRATPTAIIPSFSNVLGSILVNRMLDLISLKQNFALKFDNSILATLEQWTIVNPIPTNPSPTDLFVTFVSSAIDNNYTITVSNTKYNFASVDQIRFIFNGSQKIYDPQSGQVFSDFVNVFATNANATNSGTLGTDYILNVTGQPVLSDGHTDDYEVMVSSIDLTSGFTYNPDFFTDVVGTSSTAYVFLQVYYDINDLYRTQVLPTDYIIYTYTTQNQVSNVIYDYPTGTVFYCSSGTVSNPKPVFFQSVLVVGTNPPILVLNDVTASYLVTTGRGAINFQYRHNSNNTTRVDPSTTNIIDLYLVTQSYYTQYQNWIQDTTGTVLFPLQPTINELQQAYGDLDSYKMISDSVILNSVTFVPLFGTKASPALQGTIKIIANPTTIASNSQIVSSVLGAMNTYFTITNWDFGDTFYMSELTAYLHLQLQGLISSVVLVSNNPNQSFGDLYEIKSAPNEIFVNGATANDVIVISSLTPAALQRGTM
jgi:hypothetical protein